MKSKKVNFLAVARSWITNELNRLDSLTSSFASWHLLQRKMLNVAWFHCRCPSNWIKLNRFENVLQGERYVKVHGRWTTTLHCSDYNEWKFLWSYRDLWSSAVACLKILCMCLVYIYKKKNRFVFNCFSLFMSKNYHCYSWVEFI